MELKKGEALFHVQINEVTSKFSNGCVTILIYPQKPINSGTVLSDYKGGGSTIDIELVKPLIIEKVVIRSVPKNSKK